MALRARQLLKQLINTHPEWNWEDLEDQGFLEIMQAFRSVPEDDSTSLVLAFTIVKEFIRRLLFLEELKRLNTPTQRLVYESRLYNAGFSAGIKELQIRSKAKKTRIEKQYIIIADKFKIDIQTVALIWSLVNGYGRTKKQIIKWAKKQYPHTQLLGHPEYYRWLATFLGKLSPDDFILFYDKAPVTQISQVKKSTVSLRADLVLPKKKHRVK